MHGLLIRLMDGMDTKAACALRLASIGADNSGDSHMKKSRFVAFVIATLALPWLHTAHAETQGYPTRPIKMIVASTAGSAPDVLARILGRELEVTLKQPIVVENRPGAGGVVGTDALSKAAADGYTLGLGHDGTMAINSVLYKNLPYDPTSDFTAVAPLALNEFVLIAHPSTGVKTFPQFIDFVKAQKGAATYASAGNGTPNHVFMEQLLQTIGAKMIHVPYRGGAAAVADVAGGQAQFMLAGIAPAQPQIKAGRVTPVAVTQPKRSVSLPDVPTAAETLKGFALETWFGLFAPARTPPAVVEILNREVQKILARPDISEKLTQQGMSVRTGPARGLAEQVQQDLRRYKELATRVKLEAD